MRIMKIRINADRNNSAFNAVIDPYDLLLPARQYKQVAGNAVGGERLIIIRQEIRLIA